MTADFQLSNKIFFLYETCARQQALFSKLLDPDFQLAAVDYYLLYRLVDTIEDADFNENLKIKLLTEIQKDFIRGLKNASEILLKANNDFQYKNLFLESADIFKFHFSLPQEIQKLIENYGKIMAGGMAKFIEKLIKYNNAETQYFIKNLDEFDEYCYYAAGCVGELNSELYLLFSNKKINAAEKNIFLKNGAQLGNYLQTVNIIRDYYSDNNKKNYLPQDCPSDNITGKINLIIDCARKKENSIKEYLASIENNNYYCYCNTLFEIAKLHIDFYYENNKIQDSGMLKKLIKPQPLKIFFKLPLKLKLHFLKYKIKKMSR
ncbi:MAG TPA: squalene/phytoene synthase family protein [bacterium]|nr:squalene/phytoene synthase family protein [bacterium]HPP86601.1 squalene/phytoene synthase family protein [bacterium]